MSCISKSTNKITVKLKSNRKVRHFCVLLYDFVIGLWHSRKKSPTRLQGHLGDSFVLHYTVSWKVRLMTSSCCSFESR